MNSGLVFERDCMVFGCEKPATSTRYGLKNVLLGELDRYYRRDPRTACAPFIRRRLPVVVDRCIS